MAIAGLIKRTAVGSEPVTITVAGEALTFRTTANYADFIRMQRELQSQVKHLRKTQKSLPADWQKYLGMLSDEAMLQALVVSRLSLEPKIEDIEALQLCAECAGAFSEIVNRVDFLNTERIAEGETEAIEAAGEESGGTPTGEPAS